MQKQMGARSREEAPDRRGHWALATLLAMTLIAFLAAATPAKATFHEILIREVYAGGAANDSYVVLQAYSAGQNFLGGHSVTAYNSSGTAIGTFTFSGSVSNGQNQMTVLVADSSYAATFSSGPAPNGTAASFDLNPSGGAICWAGLDCVSWGSFSGTTTPTSGSPADPAGIPTGMAIRRSIAPGCATLLELGDDSNSSAADFADATPNPRSNATVPTEVLCPALPNTVIDTKPTTPTKSTAASFTYHAVPASGASFECSIAKVGEADSFASCPGAGTSYSSLEDGNYVFKVRAVNSAGSDPSPAAANWTVDTKPPTAEIKNHPADPSPGGSAAFTYQASEAGATFECSLALGAAADSFSPCPSAGTSYTNLADGDYTFKVRATDPAGNGGAADSFDWEVDNSLADTTPPQTTITSMPPDPSTSPTASFTYASNESASSFECALDGAGFTPCPAAGITYSGLSNGPHSFQVQATDSSQNKDPSPAGYSFQVVLGGSVLPASAPPPAQVLPVRPNTTISGKPAAKTRDRTPTFRFGSNQSTATFQCKLDGQPFKTCRSPLTTKKLPFGRHVLQVRAIAGGLPDPSPVKFEFRVVKT
jgi:hypothetical protein